jgi:hypothetical protein
MLSWTSILYGAALSAVVAGAAITALARPRQPAVILTGMLATAVGPLAWNAILRATHASQFFTDAPCACCRPAGKTPARACSPWPPPPYSSASGRWRPGWPGARSGWPCCAAWPHSWSTSTSTDLALMHVIQAEQMATQPASCPGVCPCAETPISEGRQ